MLTDYIQAALRHARYEILPDDNTYYGEIPECRGVWANADTLEACRDELRDRQTWTTRAELASAFSEWIEAWYNPRRRHTSVDDRSPMDYERPYAATKDAA